MSLRGIGGLDDDWEGSLTLVLDISNITVGISMVGHSLETAVRERDKVLALGKVSCKTTTE